MVNNPLLKKLQIGERSYETRFTRKFERRRSWVPPDPSLVRCVIPGVIREIYIVPGQKIDRNESLMILEAMKMQNDIRSSSAGTVRTVRVQVGQMVTKGDPLVELDVPPSEEPTP